MKKVQTKKAQSLKRIQKQKIQIKKLKPLLNLCQQDQEKFQSFQTQQKPTLQVRQEYSQMVKENYMPRLAQSQVSKSIVPKRNSEDLNLHYMQYLDLKRQGLENLEFARSNKKNFQEKKCSPEKLRLPNLKTNYLDSFKRKDQTVNYKKKLMQEFQQIEENLKQNENSPDRMELKIRFHRIDNMYIPNNINYDKIYFNTMKQKLKFIESLNEQL